MKIFWVWNDSNYEENEFENESLNIEETTTDFEEWQVAVDIIENPSEIIIISPIAWVDFEDIDLSIKEWVLIISWERKKPLELYLNWSVLRVSEIFFGHFKRTIILPENLDFDNIKAVLDKSILVVKIPKLKFSWKTIEIENIDNSLI